MIDDSLIKEVAHLHYTEIASRLHLPWVNVLCNSHTNGAINDYIVIL